MFKILGLGHMLGIRHFLDVGGALRSNLDAAKTITIKIRYKKAPQYIYFQPYRFFGVNKYIHIRLLEFRYIYFVCSRIRNSLHFLYDLVLKISRSSYI